MIHAYFREGEINGYSAEQRNSYKFFRHDHKFESASSFFNFPLKTQEDQRYIYPIRLTGMLVNRLFTFLPKNHVFHIPDSVLADIKNNKCKLVFDYSAEPFNCTYKNKMDLTDYFVRATMMHYGLTKEQVILTTANVKIYKDVPYTVCVLFRPITFIPCATKEWTSKQIDLIKSKADRKFKMLSLMRQTKMHRIKFAYDIFRHNYRDDNLITCHLPKNKNHFRRINYIPECEDREFFNSLPWAYDDPSKDYNAFLNTEVEQTMYLDSYVNIVIESFVEFVGETTAEYELDISEKIFKPISRMQPFVVYGQPGILAYLKSIGYKTFDNWWDESYDSIEDSAARYQMIFDIFKMLTHKSKAELANMLYDMLPILEHNRSLFDKYVKEQRYLDEFNEVLAASFDK